MPKFTYNLLHFNTVTLPPPPQSLDNVTDLFLEEVHQMANWLLISVKLKIIWFAYILVLYASHIMLSIVITLVSILNKTLKALTNRFTHQLVPVNRFCVHLCYQILEILNRIPIQHLFLRTKNQSVSRLRPIRANTALLQCF